MYVTINGKRIDTYKKKDLILRKTYLDFDIAIENIKNKNSLNFP